MEKILVKKAEQRRKQKQKKLLKGMLKLAICLYMLETIM